MRNFSYPSFWCVILGEKAQGEAGPAQVNMNCERGSLNSLNSRYRLELLKFIYDIKKKSQDPVRS